MGEEALGAVNKCGGVCERVVVGVQLLGALKGEPERCVEMGDAEVEEEPGGESVRPGVEDQKDRNGVSLLVLWKEIHLVVVLNGVRVAQD